MLQRESWQLASVIGKPFGELGTKIMRALNDHKAPIIGINHRPSLGYKFIAQTA